jgi:rare lipoprotein A (peptidoglycan hydrolase)
MMTQMRLPSLSPSSDFQVLTLTLLLAQGCSLTSGVPTSINNNMTPAPVPQKNVGIASSADPTFVVLGNIGSASWYGPGFNGKKTASGEIFDEKKFTAAHKTLPLGSQARVTNLKNGKSVKVEINDRGPYAGDRIIDLSKAAAGALGMVEHGVVDVRIDPLIEESRPEIARAE